MKWALLWTFWFAGWLVFISLVNVGSHPLSWRIVESFYVAALNTALIKRRLQ